MRTWTFAFRIGAAFFTLVAISACVGLLALVQSSRINNATLDIADNWLPSVEILGKIRVTANRIRRVEPDHLFAFDPAEMDKLDKSLSDLREVLSKQEAAYAKLISSPEEDRLWRAALTARDQYLSTQIELLKLSRLGDAGFKEAVAYFRGTSRSAFNAYAEALGNSAEYNSKGAEKSRHDSQEAYASSRVTIFVLLTVAILIGIVLSLLILKNVRSVIGGDPADAAAAMRRVAAGDLTSEVQIQAGDQSSLLAELRKMQQALTDVVAKVRISSDSIATGSTQIASGNSDLSQRTEEQASALEQTAATMEQLGSTVRNNADSARQANQLAQDAASIAGRGGDVVGQVVTTMQSINDSGRKIGEITSVIDGIAFQTNILALNAAVEAARAGEQGRGFAVVAGEVRTLAQRSAEAAKEIKTLLNLNVERVEHGAMLVDEAGRTMAEIVQSIQDVSTLVSEIAAATSEQSNGIDQVGEAVGQLDKVTQQNAALVEESAAAAASLNSQAQQLVDVVSVFKLDRGNAPVRARPQELAVPNRSSINKPTPNQVFSQTQKRPAAQKNLGGSLGNQSDDWESF